MWSRNRLHVRALVAALFLAQAVPVGAQTPPAATSPLGGAETVYCLQGGSQRACTPNSLYAGARRVSNAQALAAAMGRTWGKGNAADDAAVEAAMNTAIAGAASTGGMIFEISPGSYWAKGTANGALQLANNGGFECAIVGACVLNDAPLSSYSGATYVVKSATLYDTGVVFRGFKIVGGWTYGRGSYSGSPETDPALGNQHAVFIHKQWIGVSDATFQANSTGAWQVPKNLVGDLVIGNFAGEGLIVDGAGGNIYSNIRVQSVGGHCANLNEYDSEFYGFDLGGCGLSAISAGVNFAENRIDFKVR